MRFEYLATSSYSDSIEIDNVGETTLLAINNEGHLWVLDITTKIGQTITLSIGPFNMQDYKPLENFSYIRKKFEYNQPKLNKMIKDFINNPYNDISTVDIIDKDKLYELIDSVKLNLFL